MTIRVTLHVPEALFERVAQASSDTDRSVAKVIVDALWDSDLSPPSVEGLTPQEQLRLALRDVAGRWTEEDDALMAQVFPGDESEPVLSHEALWELMPKGLDPPLSQTVIDLREDRV